MPRSCSRHGSAAASACALGLVLLASAARADVVLVDTVTAQLRTIPCSGVVYCATPDGQGGAYVGGSFTSFGGVARANVAHLGPGGAVDGWAPETDGPVTGLLCSDTLVYLGGTFTHVGATARTRLAAVSTRTAAVTAWAPSASAQVECFARVGTRVFVGGGFSSVNGVSRLGLAVLDAGTGALLPFTPAAQGYAYTLAVRDTEVFAGGEFGLRALSPATGKDTRSLATPNAWVKAIAIADGVLYVGGGFTRLGGAERAGAGAVDLASGLVTAWDPSGGTVKALAASGEAIWAGGEFSFIGGGNRSMLARLSRGIGRATVWAAPPSRTPALVVVPTGAGLLAATSFDALALPTSDLVRPSAAFPELNGPVYASLVVGDTLYLGGEFSRATAPPGAPAPDVARTRLAAIRASTGELLDWNPSVNGTVYALRSRGGAVIALGAFTRSNASPGAPWEERAGVAILDRSSGAALALETGLDVSPGYGGGAVRCGELVHDTLYVGGRFSQAGGVSRRNACAFDLRTLRLTDWDPQATGDVFDIARSGASVFLAGGFYAVGGVAQRCLAEVDAVTGTLGAWRPGVTGQVRCLVADGATLYAAGSFYLADGKPRANGAAWSLATRALLPWDPRCLWDAQLLEPFGGGFLVATNTNYFTLPPVPSLAWVDGVAGASLGPPPLYTSDRIWTVAAAGGWVFLGGVHLGFDGSTDHGYFTPIPTWLLPTPTVQGIVEARASVSSVRLRLDADPVAPPDLERRVHPGGEWGHVPAVLARVGSAVWLEDRGVNAGVTYGYRLAFGDDAERARSAEVIVAVPRAQAHSLLVVGPNPVRDAAELRWDAADPGDAAFELLDLAGRRVLILRERFGTGAQQARLEFPAALPPGVYLLRATLAGRTSTHRLCRIR